VTEAVRIGNATLYCGDCLDVLRTLPDASIEAIVTDPPYGLAFMGKHWDYDVPAVEVWQECLRVLKPGGHLLAFAGTRTFHRMAVRIEDAGFEIRDMIAWVYGSGFPKSLDVSKALDKLAGAEREVIGDKLNRPGYHLHGHDGGEAFGHGISSSTAETRLKAAQITAPATDAAQQWHGWGTALKPALEPIALCRKPLDGTVAQNVLTHGVGAINVDGCRVGDTVETWPSSRAKPAIGEPNALYTHRLGGNDRTQTVPTGASPAGRWPANLIHDGSDEVVELFPQTTSGELKGYNIPGSTTEHLKGLRKIERTQSTKSEGSAARFFYCAKADKSDRDEGCDDLAHGVIARSCQAQAEAKRGNAVEAEEGAFNKARLARNHHPTVKPTELMRYLCRLVTPPGGTILDPFMGSGSTGRGAALEGFRFIGIEREPDYLAIAQARIKAAQRQPDLFHIGVAA
jgi:site-specific DNA-methyltransferase (adenine-specific)